MSLKLDIISPVGTIFSGFVKEVTLPGSTAPFTILPMHAPIISSLNQGVVSFLLDNNEKLDNIEVSDKENIPLNLNNGRGEVDIKGGFIEMNEDKVTVCIL